MIVLGLWDVVEIRTGWVVEVADVIRGLLVLAGLLLGCAIIYLWRDAPRIYHAEHALRGFRVRLLAMGLLTIYCSLDMADRLREPVTLRLPFALAALAVAAYSSWYPVVLEHRDEQIRRLEHGE